MKCTIPAIAGLCAGLTLLASPALAGPEHKEHNHADKAAEPKLEDFAEPVQIPELFIGSKAPELQIAKFVKGDSVQSFEPGQVYVVEFWATWCGPCIAAFPHLSELQEEYKGKAQFIGVNIWEGVDDQAERIEKVEGFVADQGDRMSYTVAVENGSAMADTWMKPAAQNGIPAAFIVDGTGTIAWVGHPMNIDKSLEQAVSGELDTAKAVENYKRDAMVMSAANRFAQGIQTGNLEEPTVIANLLVDKYINEDQRMLNAVSWMLINADGAGEAQYKTGYKAIKKACELTEWEDWSILDTYAMAAHKLGKNDEAVKWQSKAVELVPADNSEAKTELQARLDEYKAAG
ncbi:MAG: TlpA family protein disulfide reductase [Phycisphaerales bacterium JB052]